jgi:two-component system NarL family sensor kinase
VRQGLLAVMGGDRARFSQHYRCADQVFQLRMTRIDQVGVPWILVTHDDVTEASLARDELSRLAEQLLTVQEEERRRIALELHDSTSQHLVALQLGLTAVRRGRATEETLEDMRRELEEAHREIRTLSYLLHPPALAKEGLTATLRGFADGFGKRTGLAVLLTTGGAIDALPFEIQRSLFRVVQEAMANAHRHAKARQITVEVTRNAGGVQLLVADDGSAADGAALQLGVGVPGMEARIRRFQGVFTIDPTPAGTSVCAFIPASGIQAAETKRDI